MNASAQERPTAPAVPPDGAAAAGGPRRRRVLLLTAGLGAGTEVWVYRHATGLKRYDCHVATLSYENRRTFPYPSVHMVDHPNMAVHRLFQLHCALRTGRWPSTPRVQAWRLSRAIARAKADLVHVHFLWSAGLAMRAAAERGVPFVVTAHGNDAHRALVNPEYRHALQPVFGAANRIIAVSDFISDRLVQAGCASRKIRRIYLGSPLPDALAEVGLQGERVNVVCVASFREKKGHAYLLEAFARALQEEPRLFLTLVGDGKLRPEIEGLIRTLGIGNRVDLAGLATPDRVREILAQSHVYAQHSVEVELTIPGFGRALSAEGLPASITEAAAFGLPVVATRSAGIPEICRHGENGFLVQERDANAMADRIVELARDPGLRARLGRNGRALAEGEFDQRGQLEKVEALYDEVLA